MGPAPATVAEVTRAVPGELLETALLITAISKDRFTGTVLELGADAGYRCASATLSVAWPASVPVVMGTIDGVIPGAVIQAQGRLTASGRLEPRRLAILTGYIQLRS